MTPEPLTAANQTLAAKLEAAELAAGNNARALTDASRERDIWKWATQALSEERNRLREALERIEGSPRAGIGCEHQSIARRALTNAADEKAEGGG